MAALSLALDQGNGIVPAYHRITRVIFTVDPNQTEVTITSFMRKVDSDDGPRRAAGPSFTFTFPGFPTGANMGAIQTWIYDQIKLRPEWSSATVVP